MMFRALLCCTLFFFNLTANAKPNPYSYCKTYQSDSPTEWHVTPDDKVNSLKRALTNAKPGDHILLAGGDYNQSVHVQTPGLIIRSKEPYQARIIVPVDIAQHPFAVKIDSKAHCTTLSDLDISGGYFYAISLESDWSTQASEPSVKYVQLLNNRIHGSGRDAVKIKPMVSEVTLWGNHIFSSGQRDPRNAEGIDVVNGHNLLITENLIERTATTGVYVKGGSSGVTISRNYVRNIGGAGVLLGFDTSPQFFNLIRNPQMYEALNATASFNIIENVKMAGIGVYAGYNILFRSNTLVNVAQETQSAILFGISYQDKHPLAKRPASQFVELSHNLVHSAKRSLIELRMDMNEHLGALVSLVASPNLDSNLFISKKRGALFRDNRSQGQRNFVALDGWHNHLYDSEDSRQSVITGNVVGSVMIPISLASYGVESPNSKSPPGTTDFCNNRGVASGLSVGAIYQTETLELSCDNRALKYLTNQ